MSLCSGMLYRIIGDFEASWRHAGTNTQRGYAATRHQTGATGSCITGGRRKNCKERHTFSSFIVARFSFLSFPFFISYFDLSVCQEKISRTEESLKTQVSSFVFIPFCCFLSLFSGEGKLIPLPNSRNHP